MFGFFKHKHNWRNLTTKIGIKEKLDNAFVYPMYNFYFCKECGAFEISVAGPEDIKIVGKIPNNVIEKGTIEKYLFENCLKQVKKLCNNEFVNRYF